MVSMFQNAWAFNQRLIWETRQVLNMTSMFANARAFNRLLFWNVNNATITTGMFDNSQGRFYPVPVVESPPKRSFFSRFF